MTNYAVNRECPRQPGGIVTLKISGYLESQFYLDRMSKVTVPDCGRWKLVRATRNAGFASEVPAVRQGDVSWDIHGEVRAVCSEAASGVSWRIRGPGPRERWVACSAWPQISWDHREAPRGRVSRGCPQEGLSSRDSCLNPLPILGVCRGVSCVTGEDRVTSQPLGGAALCGRCMSLLGKNLQAPL